MHVPVRVAGGARRQPNTVSAMSLLSFLSQRPNSQAAPDPAAQAAELAQLRRAVVRLGLTLQSVQDRGGPSEAAARAHPDAFGERLHQALAQAPVAPPHRCSAR